MAAVDHDATVPVVRGQHGLYRRQCRARLAARVRHRRHNYYGHVETVERPPDVPHQFDSFSALADSQYMARIWGGVHYRFDQVAGQRIGNQVAEYVFMNFMARRDGRDD